ncbi:MAG: hypothetical protein KC912_02320 [Proteobacteria bacterium]|nr:hypothetical protein [Pseudomonadota bacterium]
MEAPVLSIADAGQRSDVLAALREAGLDWTVVAPAEVPADAAVVLSDAHRASPAMRKKLRHDVRTPLAVLLGQADLLELEPLTARQLRCVETVRRHCDRLEQMLAEIARDVAP